METSTWGFAEGDEIAPGRHALRLLGGGHRYEAYLAWDDELHSIAVAKMLRPHLVEEAYALKGLRNEGSMLSSLNHPVLLRSFDLVDEGPRPHLLLEHLEGPRLSTLLRKQTRLSLEQALMLGTQLSSALIYLHNKEIVHLDVKPRNIIMSGPPRLIDLSVAQTFERAAEAQEPIGTDAYMAPEQIEPRLMGGMSSRSDVWGWGTSMYEAITGTLPFPRVPDADITSDRFPQLFLDPAPMPRDVPEPLADLVMSTLAKRPDDRPSQLDVAEALEPFVAAMPRRIVLSRFRPR